MATVKARIAVVVGSDGRLVAIEIDMGAAVEVADEAGIPEPHALYFVEADLEIPEAQEPRVVQGRVERSG